MNQNQNTTSAQVATKSSETPATPLQFTVSITTAQAQLAAGADYDAVLAYTGDGQAAAEAYHLAFQRLARLPGGPGPVCTCEMCRGEFGGAQ